MIVLAIDTSTTRAALALGRRGHPPRIAPAEADAAGGHRHGRGLLPSIEAILSAENLKVTDLDAIAIGLGPGSYTGLRVGLTAAKALAFAARRPLVEIDSMEAIARNAPDEALQIAVVADAQRGDAYVSRFARESPGAPIRRIGGITIEPILVWGDAVEAGTCILGPSLDRLRSSWPSTLLVGHPDLGYPNPMCLIPLAFEALAADRRLDPFFVEPIYMRRSAAEDQWDRREPKTTAGDHRR